MVSFFKKMVAHCMILCKIFNKLILYMYIYIYGKCPYNSCLQKTKV
jgi:hypothetical protein